MAESYSVKAILSAKDSGFSSTLKDATSATETLGSKIKSGFAFGVLTGVGQQAFSALCSGARNLIGEIDSSNAAWKTFQSNLEMLNWDSKEIDSAKKDLQEFAQQTVYSSSDMATTFAQLAAVGVDNTTELVKGFGGLAAAAENPQQAMKTLSQQATQMAAKPTVAWADFKLMLEQTPAGIAAVAKEMGMSTSEMVTAVQDGKIATDEFFNAIIKAGGSGTELAKLATEAKTVGQAMDGLTETLGNKLTPAFDVLSQAGISAVDSVSSKLATLDASAIADKVSSAVETAKQFLDTLVSAFDGVGTSVSEAWGVISSAITGTTGEFSKTDALETFKSACEGVAGAITTVSDFIVENQATIQKVMPYVLKLAGAFAAYKVVNSVAPGLTSFAGSLLKMAGKGIGGLAAKLLGIAGAQKATGAASATSAPSIMQSALATLALGGAVLLAAAGLALLVQSAIALASAGWPAVAALVGLVGVIALLAIGAATIGPALTAGAVGFIAFGAAIALVGVGALLAATSLAIMAAVLPTIVSYGALGAISLLQLGSGLALFAVGAALAGVACIVLGAGLLLIASALVIAGAGMILMGTGALLAAASLALLSLVLPTIASYGVQGAVAIAALGASLVVFAVGAALAGVAALVLGAGLLLVSAAVVVLAAGVLALSVGALLTAASLAIVAAILPTIATYGTSGAVAIVALGASMLVFAAGAGVAGVAVLALSVGLIAASVGIAAAAITITLLAASMTLLAASTILAAAGFAIIAFSIQTILASGMMAALVLTQMTVPLLLFVPTATLAGAAALVLAAGFTACAVATLALGIAVLALGAGILVLATGALLASASLAIISAILPAITAYGTQGAMSIVALGAALAVFALGAGVAGVACAVLGAGLAVVGVGLLVVSAAVLVLCAGVLVLCTGVLALAAAALVVSAALALVSVVLPLIANYGTQSAAAIVALGGAMVAFAAGALTAGAGLIVLSAGFATSTITAIAFGVAMTTGAVGVLAMGVALKSVSSSMKTISKNAKSAEKSLDSMKDSVSIVESGLDALGSKAKSAMNKLKDAFDDTAKDAKSSGKKVGTGFTEGMQGGLAKAPAVAMMATSTVALTLNAGRSSAYAAGAYISQGFAQGMLSCLSVIRSAAAQMAAAADEAVRAKAKIHSPSKVSDKLGSYWGEGFANGIASMAKDVWDAATELVSIPNVATPNLAMAYGGEMSADYDYYRNSEYTIEVPLYVDGKEFAKANATYMQDELDKKQTRDRRKHGKV